MDYKYWNEYYKKSIAPKEPSDFARFCSEYMKQNEELLELGCGNGRDSMFFSNNKLNVTAIDQSSVVIEKLRNDYSDIKFIDDDFINTEVLEKNNFSYIYSRFTLHSITENEENILFERVYNSLNKEGLFFIEARSVKDEIFGLGEMVDRNTYKYNNHSRRFLVFDEIIKKLKNLEFDIVYSDENKDYAVYKDMNPVVIRIIAQKK